MIYQKKYRLIETYSYRKNDTIIMNALGGQMEISQKIPIK